MRRTRLAIAGAGAAALMAPATALAVPPVVTMSGSTSVAPLAAQLARGYLKQYPGRVKFKLAQGGSNIGIADVAAGRVTIGNSSRDPQPSDPSGLVFHKIAKDAICLITNPANRVADLSQATIQAIYSGKIVDWKDVPGSKLSGSIDLVGRTAASGTHDAFQKIFLGKTQVSSRIAQKASNGLVQQTVKQDRQAIGYVSLAFTQGVSASTYKGVSCTLRNAKSGTYGGVRNFWMVTRGRPASKSPEAKFLRWVLRSPKADRIVATEWVPLH
jgi:phosphate transport system substrate-binding protein